MMPLGVSEKFLRTKVSEQTAIDLTGTEGFHQHADRLGDADGVGELNLDALGKSGGDDVLGNVARHVGG